MRYIGYDNLPDAGGNSRTKSASGIWNLIQVAVLTASGRWATPSAVATDPDFASVSLLAHFDGSGTTYTDSSATPTTLANSAYNGGGDTQSTAQAKFGPASLLVSASTAAAVQADAAAPSGTQDFTAELFVYGPSSIYNRFLVGTSTIDAAGATWELGDRSLVVNGSTVLSYSAPSVDTWQHYAVVRESNTWRVYRDGVELGNVSDATSLGSGHIYIGGLPYYGSNGFLSGHIDEVRVTLGVVRYPGGTTFTPTTEAFPDA